MNKEKTLSIISTVGMFLLLEVLTFVSFGLSNSYIVYTFIGLAVAILLFVAHFHIVKKEGFSSLIVFLIPVFLLGIVTALSVFNKSLETSIFLRILTPIGFIAFAALGYLSTINKGFKISTALMLIYGGLALYVLISYFVTMVQYVPFYTITYRNSYIYYNGSKALLPIGSMAYVLNGFSLHEASVAYFSLFPSVLSTAVIALLFISPKKETKKFVLYAIYAFIGIIALITMPTKFTILTDVLLLIAIVLIILFGKKKINSLIFGRVLLVISILFLLAFIVLIINAQSSWGFVQGFRNLITKSSLLNRIFNTNGLASRYNLILNECFSFGNWLGFIPGPGTSVEYKYMTFAYDNIMSDSIIFDTILFSGVFGLAIFIVLLVFIVRAFMRYYKNSNDEIVEKSLIAGFLISFFGYSFVNYDSYPFIFYSDFKPYYLNGLFLVSLFFFGYTYRKANEKPIEEENQQQEGVVINDEI